MDKLTTELAETLRNMLPASAPAEMHEADSDGLRIRPTYHVAGGERPGHFPFTRGKNENGYLDNLWVMGQYSGYATPRETNQRFRALLEAGQTGLSIALDLPTQMGLDSDASLAEGEIGKVGTPIDTVEDLIALLDGLPLERVRQIRTSANAIGPIFTAFLVVALKELGADTAKFRVMLQNDPLKEFSARGTYIFPPRPSVQLAVDVIEYFASNLPHWEPIEFCGYHYRDSGASLVQEVALATLNGLAYLDMAVERGVKVESFVGSLFIFLSTGVDVLRECAKLRAARRLWAKLLHERYGVPKEISAINVFVYTLGSVLAAQEPLNNVVRVTLETLAAVLGGAQTIATSSYDEALGLPSLEAAQLALRTQQIVAYESGLASAVDPIGQASYVEELTDQIEAAVLSYASWLAEQGGAIECLGNGLIQREIADAAYRYQASVESGERVVVGVNRFRSAASPIRAFAVPQEMAAIQVASLRKVRESRSSAAVAAALSRVSDDAVNGKNSIPSLIQAARARATLGEIVGCLKSVHGEYDEPGGF
jgi:methylmalonyl-CoA mutase N-terminal domain/subunit